NAPLDGTNVPSPMADPSSKNLDELHAGKEAIRFWIRPEQLSSNALRCSLCHDNDAWMHTPYVDQADVPDVNSAGRGSDTFAKDKLDQVDPYQLVNAATFFAASWPKPISIVTAKVKNELPTPDVREQECIGCHRISG